MDTVSLKVSFIHNSTTSSFTVNYVNPSATYEQLDGFARKLIGLTSNTYIDSQRIVTSSVNENLAGGGN